MGTPILFSPADVGRVLAAVPSVAALLPDPVAEGTDSEAFPGVLRKTDREVYRWIANTHYEHLAEAVKHLERTHAAGCSFGHLLTTTDRQQFVSYTAELLVADDLLRRGYTVATIPRSGNRTPDLHVTGDGVDLAVEVYSPRELVAADEWVREVSDLLSYADVAASYRSSVDTALERSGSPEQAQPDSWTTAEMLERTRAQVMAEITGDVEESLRTLRPLTKVYRHPGTPLLTTVELENLVRPASVLGPVRSGSISSPGFGGYSPAGVFASVVRRTLKKAEERQVQGVTAVARALVVYLPGTKIAEDLVHPAHAVGAEAALDGIDPQRFGLDAIAFVVRTLPPGLGAIFTVGDDTTLTVEQVSALFAAIP